MGMTSRDRSSRKAAMTEMTVGGRNYVVPASAADPANDFAAVTKSDSTVLSGVRALYIGGAGDVVVRSAGSSTSVTFKAVPAGTILPAQAEKVMAATTATDIVALF